MKKFLFFLFVFVSISTVRAEDIINYAPRQISAEEQHSRDKAAEFARAIGERRVVLGMTAEQCLAAWGTPTAVNRTTTSRGSSEQWVYRTTGHYLYLVNGILTTLQD
jgi:hypothetical protein